MIYAHSCTAFLAYDKNGNDDHDDKCLVLIAMVFRTGCLDEITMDS